MPPYPGGRAAHCVQARSHASGKEIDIAFIGLKAYCGDDYRKVVRLPNFFVWAQHELGFSKTMKPIMDIYCSALRECELGEGTAYYTNYLKVVPPSSHFGPGGGAALDAAIGQADGLGWVCQRLMCDEVTALIANGCRTFVCFGILASDYFQSAMDKGFECTMKPAESRIFTFDVAGTKCLVVRGTHFGARGSVKEDSISLAEAMCPWHECGPAIQCSGHAHQPFPVSGVSTQVPLTGALA